MGLGVLEKGAPRAAVVAAPVLGETYIAHRGGGAFLNGEPIKVTDFGSIEGCRMIASQGMINHPSWERLMAGSGTFNPAAECDADSDVLGGGRQI